MPIDLTADVWAEMRRVNNAINLMPYRVDLELYDKPEFWTVMSGRGGDCEDYALTKRQRLIEFGLDPLSLLPAIGLVEGGTGHAVLLANTNMGAYVLDNIEPRILAQSDHHCSIKTWLRRADPSGVWMTL